MYSSHMLSHSYAIHTHTHNIWFRLIIFKCTPNEGVCKKWVSNERAFLSHRERQNETKYYFIIFFSYSAFLLFVVFFISYVLLFGFVSRLFVAMVFLFDFFPPPFVSLLLNVGVHAFFSSFASFWWWWCWWWWCESPCVSQVILGGTFDQKSLTSKWECPKWRLWLNILVVGFAWSFNAALQMCERGFLLSSHSSYAISIPYHFYLASCPLF